MVGVSENPRDHSVLARVSIVNFHGVQLYDSFVQPKEKVTDWRTVVSGITPGLMENARSLKEVQSHVAKIMNGRILVGHTLRKDLGVLMLSHPKRDVRDTSQYKPFREVAGGNTPALKLLASEILGIDIQGGAHSSVEDARVCMALYQMHKDGFESEHGKRWPPRTIQAKEEDGEEGLEKNGEGEVKKKRKNRKKSKK
jgi:RNA exonuclease 4